MRRAVIASPSDDAASGLPGLVTADRDARRAPTLSKAPTAGSPVVPPRRLRMLSTPAEFERCLSQPPIARSGAFALHFAPLPVVEPAADAAWRLGLVIPKRHEPSAVARNTIKRRWRAAFARVEGACVCEFGAADVVVRLQARLVGKNAAPDVVAALAPAKRRARDTFDPLAILGVLADRLRRTGPRVAATSASRRPRTAVPT